MVLRSNIVLYFSISGSSVWTVVHRDLVILRGHQLNLDLLISRDVRWRRCVGGERKEEKKEKGGEKKMEAAARAVAKREEEGKRGEEEGKEREEEEERKEVAAVVAAPLFPAKETEEVQ
ncbi:hypothetical protein BHM03_00045608 [Ensete ventricosum]|nr:hypothetical protein BHM03_00045608 [Ensete ventricosum]